jgi:hypothetical protein
MVTRNLKPLKKDIKRKKHFVNRGNVFFHVLAANERLPRKQLKSCF